ncbi:MAG TPA: NAD(P)H-quinone oxidoreductase [Rhodobiaceae bacterium]|nr:NAD(P)H-quinone oxidoreductase [Rhodobiaceae bacterium]|tara:strand:- start:1815 stop:2819 length:1005 start_codon:yes stop_codon:yes gene_type:complete
MSEKLPQNMNAVAIGADGAPDSLHLTTRNMPQPQANEILVRIGAAGVNRGDCMQRIGLYPPPPGAPDIMGLEFAGTVVARGDMADKWQLGSRVTALVAGGGYAEYACVNQDHALAIPDDMSFTDAAALPETIFTVFANVFEGGDLQKGETLLVHGGSSGIGTTAIQMAKHSGAKVVVTAGSDDKCAACRDLGADLTVNYKSQDFVEACHDFTEGAGINVILDMVGGDYIARNMEAAALGGRIVNIAYMQGFSAEVNFLPVMLKRLTLTGSTLRARPLAEKTRLTQAVNKAFWPYIGAAVKPIVDSVYPLAEASKAHAHMESSLHIGKIILDCSS